MRIADSVCEVMQIEPSIDGLEHPRYLGRWLYVHCDEFWAPMGVRDAWEHLQYIYDEYMAKPETQKDMWRQSLTYVQRHPSKRVMSRRLWDTWQQQMGGQERVSYEAQNILIDEIMDNWDEEGRVSDEARARANMKWRQYYKRNHMTDEALRLMEGMNTANKHE